MKKLIIAVTAVMCVIGCSNPVSTSVTNVSVRLITATGIEHSAGIVEIVQSGSECKMSIPELQSDEFNGYAVLLAFGKNQLPAGSFVFPGQVVKEGDTVSVQLTRTGSENTIFIMSDDKYVVGFDRLLATDIVYDVE